MQAMRSWEGEGRETEQIGGGELRVKERRKKKIPDSFSESVELQER